MVENVEILDKIVNYLCILQKIYKFFVRTIEIRKIRKIRRGKELQLLRIV